jgi:DNA-binding CsgD family transcriptional regulator
VQPTRLPTSTCSGRVVAADESARTIFAYLERFDIEIETQQKKCAITDALQYIASVLKQIFHDRGETGTMCSAPVVRLHSHWSGIVLRLRGIVAYGDDGGRYFTVIVEQGELKEHRQRRLMYRWGLSPREFEIVAALAEHARTSEMAYRMHLSTGTLKAYLQRLADKLNVEGMSALRKFVSQELAT